MNRILDFTPSQEEALVARVLVLVHQTIDEAFPSAEKATRQFTKTVFSDDTERTAIGRPGDSEQFADVESTGPNRAAPPPPPATAESAAAAPRGGHQLPPPPAKGSPTAPAPAADKGAPSYVSQLNPVNTQSDKGLSGVTNQSSMQRYDSVAGPDWVTRFTLALLIAGLVLLAYALFS